MENDYLKQAIKRAIKDNVANSTLGFKDFQIISIKFRNSETTHFKDNNGTVVRYDVLVKHKEIEELTNLSAFEVCMYEDGLMQCFFNGCGGMEKRKGHTYVYNFSISYGSFTREMANVWLKQVEAEVNA